MTINGLKMGLETQCCFQPVLPLSAGWRREAGTSAGAQTKKERHAYCVSFFWRRRRDSNPRDPLGAYMISNHAPSTN